DACDDEPLDPDLDGDGVANLEDNCPFHGNEDQADADEDGKGAFCDPCDDRPNPTTVCEPIPPVETFIENIQLGDFEVDTNVAVSNVVVTAVYDLGLWVQDPNADTPDYSGIYVFTGSDHGA